MIAVVGGDGAGKTTAVAALAEWLGEFFSTHVLHLGKPPRSFYGASLKGCVAVLRGVGLLRRPWLPHYPQPSEHGDRVPSYAWLLWQYLTAHDRYREYRRARSLATRGDLVVCDRFPTPHITLMDGSRTQWIKQDGLGVIAKTLVAKERDYYARISSPDLLIVLSVDPDTAVARKQGVDPADFVRPRADEVYNTDWSSVNAVVLDASQRKEDVLAQLRRCVWERL